jgi:transcriptional regulator with XRE-family HTH domain
MAAPSQPDPFLPMVLKNERYRAKLTQEDLAHLSGLTVAAYARIERGTVNPTWTTVLALSKALKLPLPALMKLRNACDEAAHEYPLSA